MTAVQLNRQMSVALTLVGDEQIPVLVIDNLVSCPEQLIAQACLVEAGGQDYQQQDSDYYPGIRKTAPSAYVEQIRQLLPLLPSSLGLKNAEQARVIMSAFSIATTPPDKLRPIQMLPHFDSTANNQWAMLHYLCDSKHGGTSLYRHKHSGFERITMDRLTSYRLMLKQQAIEAQLHLTPRYSCGDNKLFSALHSVEAKMNRAVIYPSNALHSGNIRPETGLLADPQQGRLTISSFILLPE